MFNKKRVLFFVCSFFCAFSTIASDMFDEVQSTVNMQRNKFKQGEVLNYKGLNGEQRAFWVIYSDIVDINHLGGCRLEIFATDGNKYSNFKVLFVSDGSNQFTDVSFSEDGYVMTTTHEDGNTTDWNLMFGYTNYPNQAPVLFSYGKVNNYTWVLNKFSHQTRVDKMPVGDLLTIFDGENKLKFTRMFKNGKRATSVLSCDEGITLTFEDNSTEFIELNIQ